MYHTVTDVAKQHLSAAVDHIGGAARYARALCTAIVSHQSSHRSAVVDVFAEPEMPDGFSEEKNVRLLSAIRGDGVEELLEDAWVLVQEAMAEEQGDEPEAKSPSTPDFPSW